MMKKVISILFKTFLGAAALSIPVGIITILSNLGYEFSVQNFFITLFTLLMLFGCYMVGAAILLTMGKTNNEDV